MEYPTSLTSLQRFKVEVDQLTPPHLTDTGTDNREGISRLVVGPREEAPGAGGFDNEPRGPQPAPIGK